MATNYIIGDCCSVDDLRCSLSYLRPTDSSTKKKAITDLNGAIYFEKHERNRVTIIKMLEAKLRTINKIKI